MTWCCSCCRAQVRGGSNDSSQSCGDSRMRRVCVAEYLGHGTSRKAWLLLLIGFRHGTDGVVDGARGRAVRKPIGLGCRAAGRGIREWHPCPWGPPQLPPSGDTGRYDSIGVGDSARFPQSL